MRKCPKCDSKDVVLGHMRGFRCAICDECESDPKAMRSIRNHQANVDADNAWNASAGYGEL